jgi:hypothetical protein
MRRCISRLFLLESSILLLNLPKAGLSLASTVYAIWFADFHQRNVGPVVAQAAETLLLIAVTQILNLMLWWGLRRHAQHARETLRFLSRTVLCCLALDILLFWCGSHFIYAGR